ncbi:T-lymphocyte surface antigen Ly-9 [Haplochromis burtoni]|uniref:T-lymphocyte surface antigen Ly-9 n=1 Tax=Haplochromis burtoni TaxID=8153 RepID=UPI0006C9414E|nr:T-lymphocyte surface antigen Ly-9 [Haplochromis burtoni]
MHSRFPVYEFHFSYVQINLCRLKMILLLSFWIVTGLMAEDPPTTYYGLKNSSVCLNVKKLPEYERVEWKFNKTIIADDRQINPKYKDRVVYSAGNLSLCIKNLADTDAGLYELSLSRNFISVSEKHQVIVQDMVPTPVIIMSKLGSNQSAGLCSITVNCSIQDYWLWSVCDEDSCRRSQKSFNEVNITIFAENRAVVCRGNNHVSTSNSSETLTRCFNNSNPDDKENAQHPPPTRALAFIIVCVLLACVFVTVSFFLVKRLFSAKWKSYQAPTNTIRSIQSQPISTLPSSQSRASTVSSSSDADPAYENADILQYSQTNSPGEQFNSMASYTIDTIYTVPGVKASSAGNNNQNTSETATVEEAQQRLTQVDTVYSVLQKPKNLNV